MKIRVLLVLLFLCSINAFSQEIDSVSNNNNDYLVDTELGLDEVEEDEESIGKIFEIRKT